LLRQVSRFECVSYNPFVAQDRQLNMTAQPIVGFLLPTHSPMILGVLYMLISLWVIAFYRILRRWDNAGASGDFCFIC
jgi:hypothetical protein